jgi:DNA-binding Lrp family transcriptional regulator
MAISAYVFIETTPAHATQVTQALVKVPGVRMAHPVTGSYDVIALVEAEDVTALGQFITRQIHRLPGVLKTTTNVVVG